MIRTAVWYSGCNRERQLRKKGGLAPSLFRIWECEVKILAVDQARHGAWSVFDYNLRALTDYGAFSFDSKKYSFAQATLQIELLIDSAIHAYNVDAVFFEDIQLRQNVQSFKKLAQLQGVLINMCEKNEYRYGLIAPTQWQSYCNARGRSAKEAKAKLVFAPQVKGKTSKILSIQFVKEKFGIDTDNDNLSDAICIGWYCVNQNLKEILCNAEK